MKIVILCGGTGTRLWPMSRHVKPKQFFPVLSEQPMIVDTYERFRGAFPPEDIYFSTNAAFAVGLEEIFPRIPLENYIVEPLKRDTAAAMGFASSYLFLRFPDEPVVFVPSDHFIGDQERFLRTLRVGEEIVQHEGVMIDIGIYPMFPSISLGYTHIGRELENHDGIRVYEFLGHKEKPDFNTAKTYVASERYLWHGNYYMWTPRKFLDAFKQYDRAKYDILIRIQDAFQEKDEKRVLEEFQKFEKISFDYAITEKMDPHEVRILRGDFGWSDIGAWDVLYDRLISKTDENKNLVQAKWIGTDTTSCLIYGPKDKLIATVGLDDLVIVHTGDVLLICQKGKAQDVKKIVERLKEGYKEYL